MFVPAILALTHFIAAALIMLFVNGVGLNPWRRAVNAHWTERARLIFPVHETAKIYRPLLPILLPLIWFQHDHSKLQYLFDIVSTYLGAVIGCYSHSREIQPRVVFKMWFFSVFINALFNAYFYGGILACTIFMPPVPGWNWLIVIVIFFALQNPFPVKILSLLSVHAGYRKPANERAQHLVHAAAASVGVTSPAAWQLTWPYPWISFDSAASAVFLSDQLLADFSDEEIIALCAHELSKISRRKRTWWEIIFHKCTCFPLLFIIPLNHYYFGLGFWMLPVTIGLLALNSHLNKSITNSPVVTGASAGNPPTAVYVRAMGKIHRENWRPVIGTKASDPNLYLQMSQAGVIPDYPIPAIPLSGFTPVGKWTLLALILLLLCSGPGSCKFEIHGGTDTDSNTNLFIYTN